MDRARPRGRSTCKAYDDFKKQLFRVRKSYSELNPKGPIGGTAMYMRNDVPGEAVMEYVRGGIISTMAAWEAYVLDLLQEAFDTAIDDLSNKGASADSNWLKERWPNCESAIQDSLRRCAARQTKEKEDKEKEEKSKDSGRKEEASKEEKSKDSRRKEEASKEKKATKRVTADEVASPCSFKKIHGSHFC